MNHSPSLVRNSPWFATTALCLTALLPEQASAQGCVAVRGGGMCTMNHSAMGEDGGKVKVIELEENH